jgi:hypothetical protein
MNLVDLHRKLIAAARANPPGDGVPNAFEKRIIARLAGRPAIDHWALWSRALWRATAPCAAIMLVFCAWSWFAPGSSPPSTDLTQEFENTVLAVADQDSAADSTW